jgi:hypothetical protein
MKHRNAKTTNFQTTSLIAAALLLLLVFVSVGYFFFLAQPGMSPQHEAMLAELQLRRSEWQEKRPPAFRYEVERQCDCPLDYIEPFAVVEYLDEPENHAWIDGYFESLEAALHSAQNVGIKYDPRFSYPNDFHIDDEQTFIRDFDVLEYE